MEFAEDVLLPEHSHEGQAGVKHSGKIYAGYADITFFNEAHRYQIKL